MEENKSAIEELEERLEVYIRTNVELYKLKALDKSSDIGSSLIFYSVVALMGVVFVLILSIGMAHWIGGILSSVYLGFLAVAGVYLITLLIFLMARKPLERNIKNSIIRRGLKDSSNDVS